MSTRNPLSIVARAALAATCVITTVSCGGELLRTGRSPVMLIVTGVVAQAGGTGEESGFLLSDVVTEGGVINDSATVTLRVEPKNITLPTTALNSVTMTRYRVVFRRSDGRNTAGVDVPHGFDGAAHATIDAGGTGEVVFELVRHQMKLEPPLIGLAGFNNVGRSISGQGFISTVAEITLWGRDQNGNEVMATTSIDVHFGDFADDE